MPSDSTLSLQRPLDALAIPVFTRSFGSWRLSVERRPYLPTDLAAHYDRQSHQWDHVIDRLGFGMAYYHMIRKVLGQPRYRQDAPALRVLDAGIGTGAMSSALRKAVGRRFQLDGIDISAAMLHQARAHLGHQDVDLTTQCADLTKLPFADNTFDVVLAAHVLEHLGDPQSALTEIYRVLKPGGIVICAITRSSLLGAYIQLKWRTHRISVVTALGWFHGCGLHSVRAVPFDKRLRARKFSVGYVGTKPGRA